MGTRTFAQVAPTAGTIALNAYIYGYGGHSLVTPHVALKRLWWTDERIEAKITRNFVVSKLRGEEREFLDRPLAFGEGLTDDTYMEWILDRAKRLFLILTEVGVPDQIFGCIDDSWDDNDLPLPMDSVRQLELAYENDEKLNRKVYDTQFLYLLRELRHRDHIDYGPKEHIPMEYVNSLPPAVCLQAWDRVHFPSRPDEMYTRRKFPLTDKESDRSYRETFIRDLRKAQSLSHEHIASTWASYTSGDSGYVLSDFVGEHTLRTFIDHRTPMQFIRLPATERPVLLCEWMHCLADALASLHHRGAAHTSIRPSNIIIDHHNRIAFSDVGSLKSFQHGKRLHKTEVYDYAAPESQVCKEPVLLASSPPISSMSAFSKLRKMSSSTTDTSSSSTGSSGGSSSGSNSFCTAVTSSITPPWAGRTNSMTSIATTISPTPCPTSPKSFRNFSRMLSSPSLPISTASSPTTSHRVLPRPTLIDPDLLRDLPEAAPEMSDIYSLACVFLDILTFMLKGKTTEFVKHRTTRVSAASSNKFRNDTSFHADPDRLDAWLTHLRDESGRHAEQIYRGVPELLKLVKRMMAQNATLRPTAMQVRDRIQEILVGECGIETLCCAGRGWEFAEILPAPNTRDSLSVAMGFGSPARTGSDFPRRLGTACEDHASTISRSGSAMTDDPRKRRRSSANTATAKLASWRRAFSRSHTR